MKSTDSKGSDDTAELVLRTVISVNQVSINGGVADLCEESSRDSPSAKKAPADENWGSIVKPTEFTTANPVLQTDAEVTRKRVA